MCFISHLIDLGATKMMNPNLIKTTILKTIIKTDNNSKQLQDEQVFERGKKKEFY